MFKSSLISFVLISTTAFGQHSMKHGAGTPKVSNPLDSIQSASSPKEKVLKENATDTRRPLPLLEFMAEHQKKNMREHLEAIRDIVGGFVKKDFKVIKEASLRLGSSPQMNMMCDHMGQGAPGFTPMALKMHSDADKIVAAAEKKDFNAVIIATKNTLQSCTNCHSAYKQQVVTQEQWDKINNAK